MTRFMKKLKKHIKLVKEIFYTQRNEVAEIKKENKNQREDARRDTEAKYGVKEKHYKDNNGNKKS